MPNLPNIDLPDIHLHRHKHEGSAAPPNPNVAQPVVSGGGGQPVVNVTINNNMTDLEESNLFGTASNKHNNKLNQSRNVTGKVNRK